MEEVARAKLSIHTTNGIVTMSRDVDFLEGERSRKISTKAQSETTCMPDWRKEIRDILPRQK